MTSPATTETSAGFGKTLGADACATPSMARVPVEVAALSQFEASALSFDATREHIAAQLDSRINEATVQAARAGREATDLRTQADRVERDYRRGALPAEDYARLRTEIASEMKATEAEAERLSAHAEATAATRAGLDAEDETLRLLTELRAAIAGRVTGAGADTGPLRAALASVFKHFWLVPAGHYASANPDGSERFLIVPEPHTGMRDERIPIPFASPSSAKNNQHGTSLW